MVKAVSGSALVWVLVLLSLLAVLGTMTIKTVIWSAALQQALCEKEQITQFAQGAFECGLRRAKRDFDLICKNKKTVSSSVSYQNKTAQLSIEPAQSKLIVTCVANASAGKQEYKLCAQIVKDATHQVCVCCFQR